jgi:ATP-binding cassette, subfamily C, bacterial CydD
MITLGILAAAQGSVIVAQADLLARTLAHLDTALLPWLAAVAVLRGALAWTVHAVSARAAASVKAGLRTGLLGAPGGRAGERVTLITRGLDALDPYFTGYLPQLFAAVLIPVIVLARVAVADWISALTLLVALPLVPLFGALVGLRTAELTGRQWALLGRLGGHFRDVLAGLPTLRAFGRTAHQSAVVRELAGEHRRATVAALRVAFLSSLVLELICTLSVAVVAVPVGLRLVDGAIPLAAGLLVLLLAPEVFLPLRALGTRFHASTEGLAAATQAFAAEPPPEGPSPATWTRVLSGSDPHPVLENHAAEESTGLIPGRPHVVLEDVTVRYPGSAQAAVDGLSLEIRPGERVVLAGPSGAGKSTVLALLLGFVEPDSGRVLIDGVDLKTLDLAGWRRRVAWVPQQPYLFAASVADNIRLGDAEASDRRVREVAQTAGAAGFIEGLPESYETVLGERGAGLSAGQRQRVALARACLRDAPLMLWDEPTARLDLAGEAALVEAAGRVLRGRTSLIVAHRPALLAGADRVVHLENGRIREAVPC